VSKREEKQTIQTCFYLRILMISVGRLRLFLGIHKTKTQWNKIWQIDFKIQSENRIWVAPL